MSTQLCCSECGIQIEAACDCHVRYDWLSLAEQKDRRKTKAIKLYEGGYTQQQIADRLRVSRETIRDDLKNFNLAENAKLKHHKTETNPKGAGRPKGGSSSKLTRRARPDELIKAGAKLSSERRVRLDTGEMISKIAAMKIEGEAGVRQEQNAVIIELQAENAQLKAELTERPSMDDLRRFDANARNVQRIITDTDTYNLFRRCLHPDSRNSVTNELLHQAWLAFRKLEALTWDKKTAPPPLPETLNDLLLRRYNAIKRKG